MEWFIHACDMCSTKQGARGTGKIPKQNRGFWNFWSKETCPKCMGTGDLRNPQRPMYDKDLVYFQKAMYGIDDFYYLAKDGNWYRIYCTGTSFKIELKKRVC